MLDVRNVTGRYENCGSVRTSSLRTAAITRKGDGCGSVPQKGSRPVSIWYITIPKDHCNIKGWVEISQWIKHCIDFWTL